MKYKFLKQIRTERFYFDKFLEVGNMRPRSVHRGANPPDFIITHAKKEIAVEITEFHSLATGSGGHPRRLVEEEWAKLQKLIEQGRKHYPDLNDISWLLFFKNLALPSRTEYQQFVRELLQFSQGSLESISDKGKDFNSFGTNFSILGNYLRKLHLQPVWCYITWEWNHSASSVGLNESEMKKTISRKLEIPRPNCASENWLLIVSGHQLSQSMGLPDVQKLNAFNEVNNMLKNGPYDKVFIFQYMYNRILLWEHSGNWEEVRKARFAGNESRAKREK
jgi:hypothetical protein